ncbi:hypothetical protein FY122_03805 [Dictyoglomus thermophilum]|uniref:hypothetical protein n=1 Tax=Dictyoglomus thermophilum TaxID=14 RepID=UPI0011EAE1BB|nr:hypothetical protein [Dictyoglomus thermophilum]TYT23350.1 hypothetical protein FY122_03805 [Dictyoglomus thermophilum]
MSIAEDLIKKIANDLGIDFEEITKESLKAFLQEKRRKIKIDILGILDRYKVSSSRELEEKIFKGEISEHPAWEDLILLENLEETLKIIEEDIRSIS